MSQRKDSDSSTSDSELSSCSAKFDPLKALYSGKAKIPVLNAPMYENLNQFESAQTSADIIPVGQSALVQKREAEKEEKRQKVQRELEEKNKQRFSQYEGMVPTRGRKPGKNVLTRIPVMEGPLGALKECVDSRLRVKVVTRNATGVRGYMHATLVAFDKQWNLALSDVLEVWKRKGVKKRKVPPALGTPVDKGTATNISPIPTVKETPLGGGVWECTRYVPQLMVRGEHVVLVNIIER